MSKPLEAEDLFVLSFTPLFPPFQAMDKASKGIDSASEKAKSGIDQADAKFKKAQADPEV